MGLRRFLPSSAVNVACPLQGFFFWLDILPALPASSRDRQAPAMLKVSMLSWC
jgi:hypothetical protein